MFSRGYYESEVVDELDEPVNRPMLCHRIITCISVLTLFFIVHKRLK